MLPRFLQIMSDMSTSARFLQEMYGDSTKRDGENELLDAQPIVEGECEGTRLTPLVSFYVI